MSTEISSLETIVVDANTAVLDENVRTNTTLDDEFVGSVRQYGVQTPAVGYRDADGIVHILAGQRRALAARKTEQPLPVVLVKAHPGIRDRIVRQIIENDQRATLTQTERIQAWKQLSLDGMTAPEIAKSLGHHKEAIKAGLTAASRTKPLPPEQTNQIDLLHLAALVPFENNDHAHAALLRCAMDYPQHFEHNLELARRDVADEELVAARVTALHELSEATITQEEIERMTEFVKVHREDQLVKNDQLTVTNAGEPDVRIMVSAQRYYGHDDAEVIETRYIYDYPSYGYELRTWASNGTATQAGPMTDEQKTVRKLLITRNKAWDAAAPVRTRWLREFVGRKTFPQDCGEFIAISLAQFGVDLANRGHELPLSLLGIDYKYQGRARTQLADLVIDRPRRAEEVTLALILGHFEAGMKREAWRYPAAEGKHYLEQIEKWGYTLCDVERLAIGDLAENFPATV